MEGIKTVERLGGRGLAVRVLWGSGDPRGLRANGCGAHLIHSGPGGSLICVHILAARSWRAICSPAFSLPLVGTPLPSLPSLAWRSF